MSNPDDVYVDHITQMGESREVIATEDIHNQHGAMLIAKGTRVDRKMYERLVSHKLLTPIDHSVEIGDGVTLGTLAKEARRLIENEPQIELMLGMLRDPEAPMRAIGRVHLEPAFANKLTVARERMPMVFAHSLKVAVSASILGHAFDLNIDDIATLTMAGLFHDLGELHIDPAIFERGHVLTPEDRQQLYAHPAISYAMLAQSPAYHPHVSRPVLEHHERLDGSGYPYARIDGDLSLPGRMLALSELVTGVCERKGCDYLDVLLRFQADKYGGDLVQRLTAVLHHAPRQKRATPTLDKGRLGHLAAALDDRLGAWQPDADGDAASTLVTARLESLKHAFARTGLPFQGLAQMFGLLEDNSPELSELEVLLRESLYHLRELGYELRRRWPEIAQQSGATTAWMNATDHSVGEALAQARPAEPVASAG
jgi:hypothetical protein